MGRAECLGPVADGEVGVGRKRPPLKWLAIGLVALIAIGVLTSVWIMNRSNVPRFSVLSGREPSERSYFQRGGVLGNAGENIDYVFEANYDHVIRLARTELVKDAGWKEKAYTWSKEPFADFTPSGPGSGIRIIRGDRTLPPSFRKNIPVKERHKWVVITFSRDYNALEFWVREMWRRMKR